jgi:DNA replication protein DnaC
MLRWAQSISVVLPIINNLEEEKIMLEQTKQQMAAMKLYGMILALDEQLNTSPKDLTFEERLSLLIDREYHYRENQRLTNRLKQAKLKSHCAIEHIDFKQARGMDKQHILTLAKGHWIQQRRPILITGPTGTGKTFLACALAHKACLLGFSARYYRLLHLLNEIAIAFYDKKLQRFLINLSRIDVLIIDDFGMMAMDDEQKRWLLEILESRYEIRSTIMTSQLPVTQWYEHLNDLLIADALLDRVVHQAEKIALTGESMRKINAKNKSCEIKED